eukprot:scaffold51390_cov62-Phaeocystis_antarctica.AAC.4
MVGEMRLVKKRQTPATHTLKLAENDSRSLLHVRLGGTRGGGDDPRAGGHWRGNWRAAGVISSTSRHRRCHGCGCPCGCRCSHHWRSGLRHRPQHLGSPPSSSTASVAALMCTASVTKASGADPTSRQAPGALSAVSNLAASLLREPALTLIAGAANAHATPAINLKNVRSTVGGSDAPLPRHLRRTPRLHHRHQRVKKTPRCAGDGGGACALEGLTPCPKTSGGDRVDGESSPVFFQSHLVVSDRRAGCQIVVLRLPDSEDEGDAVRGHLRLVPCALRAYLLGRHPHPHGTPRPPLTSLLTSPLRLHFARPGSRP